MSLAVSSERQRHSGIGLDAAESTGVGSAVDDNVLAVTLEPHGRGLRLTVLIHCCEECNQFLVEELEESFGAAQHAQMITAPKDRSIEDSRLARHPRRMNAEVAIRHSLQYGRDRLGFSSAHMCRCGRPFGRVGCWLYGLSMSDAGWSVEVRAAEDYERYLVPALFDVWAPRMLEAAGVGERDTVLDVACGTGIVARGAVARVGDHGRVVGLDATEAMLAVAERIEPRVEWHVGDAGDLPFDSRSFDAAICQSGLMFFPDQVAAVREMSRMLRPGGRVAVQVWANCEAQNTFAGIVEEHAGAVVADQYRTPWNLSDPELLLSLFEVAGLADVELRTVPENAVYPSVDAFLAGATGILIGADLNTERLASDTEQAFSRYVTTEGTLSFEEPGHIVTATRT
jgi:SAM-dependent methyltransferase